MIQIFELVLDEKLAESACNLSLGVYATNTLFSVTNLIDQINKESD